MLNAESLKARLKAFKPIYIENRPGVLRILERSTRDVFDVLLDDPVADQGQIEAQIESLISQSPASEKQPRIRLSIHVRLEEVSEITPRAIVALADLAGSSADVRIILYLNCPTFDWAALKAMVMFLRQHLRRSNEIGIRLVAPFGEFHEEMPALFYLGLRVRFMAGWIPECEPGEIPPINLEALQKFTEFGFRTIIEWYVHQNNIQQIEELLPNLLVATTYSGCSLPLVCQSPYYRFDKGFPALPNAMDYCRLLSRVYKNQPHYDDVFWPLASIMMLIQEGGWNAKQNLPSEINLIFDEKGRIGVFRQAPALAHPWIKVSEAAQMSSPELDESFLRFAKDAFQPDAIPYCRECSWRYTCGGLDNSVPHLASADLDTMCGHRKLFLRHFATVRAADVVFGTPSSTTATALIE
jgi:hypothetical protein